MAQIDSLAAWKPELKARLAKLDLSVSVAGGIPCSHPEYGMECLTTNRPRGAKGSLHMQLSHGAVLLIGKGASVILKSPTTTPCHGYDHAPSMFPAPI